jgi:hypothetical protein
VRVSRDEYIMLMKSGQRDKAMETRKRFSKDFEIEPLVKAAENNLRQLRKHKREVEASEMPLQARKERLEAIDDRMDQVMMRVRARWLELHRK